MPSQLDAQGVEHVHDPPHQQEQIRTQLAFTLQGVIAQTLLKRKDGAGRVAAFEIMMITPAIKNLIKSGKTPQIYSAMQTGKNRGMRLMTQSLEELCRKGLVSRKEALNQDAEQGAAREAEERNRVRPVGETDREDW